MPQSKKTGENMVPVLYCDIDGTIRHGKDELGHFVNGPEDVKVFEGVPDLLWKYRRLGWRIVGVSNQGGVALGHMDMKTCVAAMTETQWQTHNAFDRIAFCTHHPDAKDPEFSVCWCRKPRPGLVIESAWAMAERNPGEIYPPHLSLFVGDRPEDEECAHNANIDFIPANLWRTGGHFMEQTLAKL